MSTSVPSASSSTPRLSTSANARHEHQPLVGSSSESEDEYEDCLVYIETDDLRTLDEIFRQKEEKEPQAAAAGDLEEPVKEIEVTFHNLHTDEPIMELQGMHFSGRVEDPPGSALFFAPASAALPKLTSDLTPPGDPLFGLQAPTPDETYQLVYKADKVIRMKKIHAQEEPEYEDYGYIRTSEDSSEEEGAKEPPGAPQKASTSKS